MKTTDIVRLYTCRVRYTFIKKENGKTRNIESSLFCVLRAANFAAAESKAISATMRKLGLEAEISEATPEAIVANQISRIYCSSCIPKSYNEKLDFPIKDNDVIFDSASNFVYRVTYYNKGNRIVNSPQSLSFLVIGTSEDNAITKSFEIVDALYPECFTKINVKCNRELEKRRKKQGMVVEAGA